MTRKYLLETLAILFGVIALVRGLYVLRGVEAWQPYIPVAVAAILVYVPIIHASWRHEPVDYIDRSRRQFWQSLQWFFIAVVLVMPPFFVANHFWQHWVMKQVYIPNAMPPLGAVLLDQLFLVALPEEIFFRGWLQNRCNRLLKRSWNILGVRIGWGLPLTALIFAASHSVIHYQWWHFSIFFPALLFGWLRERTNSVIAPTLFHALSNITSLWIVVNYT